MRIGVLIALLVSAASANDDPAVILQRSIQAVKENSAKARNYAYRERRVVTDIDSKGKPGDQESETWDVIALEGSTYRKLVARDDRPLSAKEQKKEDERLRKETERRRKENLEQRRRRLFSYEYHYQIPYSKLGDIYDLRMLPEEQAGGRRTWVLEGVPKLDFKPQTADEKEAVNFRLTLWLDQVEFLPVRIGLEVIGDHSRLSKGSTSQIDLAKINDDAWLVQRTSIRFAMRPFRVLTLRGEQVTTFSKFQKFQVDSKLVAGEGRQP